MRSVRQAGTKPEETVRRLLREMGAGYRTNVKTLPGRPDIANRSRRKAIFVNGCYWHFHDACDHGALPASNAAFWREKFEANRRRDQQKIIALEEEGFDVLVVWECELHEPDVMRKRLGEFWGNAAPNGKGTGDRGGGAVQLELKGRPGEGAPAVESYAIDLGRSELVRSLRTRNGPAVESRLPLIEPVVGGDVAAAFDQTWLRLDTPPLVRDGGESVRIVDLFSGCGGMTLGAVEACRALDLRPEPVMAWDTDPQALGVYHQNFERLGCDRVDDRPIEDILDGGLGGDATESEQELREDLGRVDLVLGGPPCQGHSNLNNHTRRHDPKNALFERMARFAEVIRPKNVVVENVHGVFHDRGGVFARTVRHLAELGYDVDHATVSGEHLGVAQRRHRVFLVASLEVRPDLGVLAEEHGVPQRSFDWACRDLMFSEADDARDMVAVPKAVTKKRIDYLFDHDLYDLPDDQRPPCHRGGGHAYPSVYGRIHPSQPAQTITTGFMAMGQGRFVHPRLRRTISPHEAARLQFIPDWFEFGSLSRSAITRLIGNAVPPKMVYAIVAQLLR